MAGPSIYRPKNRKSWVVEWLPLHPELDKKGRPKTKRYTASAPTEAQSHALAERLKLEIVEAARRGRDWAPPKRRPHPAQKVEIEPSVTAVLAAWLSTKEREHDRALAQGRNPATFRGYQNHTRLFARFLSEERGLRPGRTPASTVTKRLLVEYYDWLLRPGTSLVQGRARAPGTAYKAVEVAVRPFRWAASSDEFRGRVFPLAMPDELRRPARPLPTVPSFEEAAAAVRVADGYIQRAMTLAYFTGLRIDLQIMQLRWDDFDLPGARLHLRGVLGKTLQEQTGRRIPISSLLRDELLRWANDDGLDQPEGVAMTDFVVRLHGAKKERRLRGRDTKRAWIRAGTWREEFGPPNHCFRSCFIEGLELAGALPAAVDRLVGHEVGSSTKRAYRNPDVTLKNAMEEAVLLIPALPAFDAGGDA